MRGKSLGVRIVFTAVAALFALSGLAVAQSTAVFTLGSPAIKKDGSAVVHVNVSSTGAVTVTAKDARTANGPVACGPSSRIKAQSYSSQAPGDVGVRLVPIGSAKRKIKDGRSVKVTALITVTPQGGAPAAQTISLRLGKRGGAQASHPVATAACSTPPPSY